MDDQKGFFASLFDLSFTEFITTRVIRFLFFVAVILLAVGGCFFVAMGFSRSPLQGLLSLIIAPLIFILYVITIRVWIELVLVIFRIEANTSRMLELKENREAQ